MPPIREKAQEALQYLLAFLKWVLFAFVVGVAVGLVGTLFHYGIEWATELRNNFPWLLWLLPVGGLIIVLVYKLCGMENDRGTNLVLLSVRSNEHLPARTAPLIFFSTCLTHLLGGSAGREGAALQLGGSLSALIGRLLRVNDKDSRLFTMCGMSAAFAALFGTPVAAVVFSMEVISVGAMYYVALIPCAIAAVVGYGVSLWLHVPPTHFAMEAVPELSVVPLLQVLVLAALCGAVSMLFCISIHTAGKLYKKASSSAYLRAAVGGVLVVALTFLVQTRDYNGAGMDVVARALDGQARPEAWLLKILFTALTLAAGFKGGEIVPAFFVGATFGCTVGGLLGLPPAFAAGIGLIAMFCGVTNCPLASLLLSVELFGADGLLYFVVAVAASYMLSGYYSLYSAQKILYSKIHPEFVDHQTH